MLSIFGAAISLPFLMLGLLISAIPVWMAAKIVGAGHQELWRAALALVLATTAAVAVVMVCVKLHAVLWGVLLMLVTVVVVFAKVLDLSYLGAFILCILSAALQVAASKLLVALFGG